jgi:hypothetical protein
MKELRKIHRSEVQDTRSVPFDLVVGYATDGGTPHEGK